MHRTLRITRAVILVTTIVVGVAAMPVVATNAGAANGHVKVQDNDEATTERAVRGVE